MPQTNLIMTLTTALKEYTHTYIYIYRQEINAIKNHADSKQATMLALWEASPHINRIHGLPASGGKMVIQYGYHGKGRSLTSRSVANRKNH